MSSTSFARAIVFYLCALVTALLVCTALVATRPFSHRVRYRIGRIWTDVNLWVLEHVVGIRYAITGAENIPPGPGIVLAKHQSAWETMGLQKIFPRQVWVLKRELFWVPLFGWGLAMLDPIAIDRKAGFRAIREIVRQGRERLAGGAWVVIFPEGTRVSPGEQRPYHPGGGKLAAESGFPVVPVAHDAGLLWPRNSFGKHAGTIHVAIGPPIDPAGLSASEITRRAQDWIETTCNRLLEQARDTSARS